MLYIRKRKKDLSLPQTAESMKWLSESEKRELEKPVLLAVLTEEEVESEAPLAKAIIRELGGKEIISA